MMKPRTRGRRPGMPKTKTPRPPARPRQPVGGRKKYGSMMDRLVRRRRGPTPTSRGPTSPTKRRAIPVRRQGSPLTGLGRMLGGRKRR